MWYFLKKPLSLRMQKTLHSGSIYVEFMFNVCTQLVLHTKHLVFMSCTGWCPTFALSWGGIILSRWGKLLWWYNIYDPIRGSAKSRQKSKNPSSFFPLMHWWFSIFLQQVSIQYCTFYNVCFPPFLRPQSHVVIANQLISSVHPSHALLLMC